MTRSLSHIIALTLYLLPVALLLSVALLLPSARLSAQNHSRRHAPATQDSSAPVLKATVDKQKILIGQPIQLMLEATVNGNAPLVWPSLDSLPHFEWVEKHNVDSSVQPGQRYYRQYLTITSFDSGS